MIHTDTGMGDYRDAPADEYWMMLITEISRHNDIQGEILLALREIKTMLSGVLE